MWHFYYDMRSQGANATLGDAKGKAALHLAAWEGHANTVAVLACAGAVDALDQWDGTALQASAAQGHERCVRLLLSYKVRTRSVNCHSAMQRPSHLRIS